MMPLLICLLLLFFTTQVLNGKEIKGPWTNELAQLNNQMSVVNNSRLPMIRSLYDELKKTYTDIKRLHYNANITFKPEDSNYNISAFIGKAGNGSTLYKHPKTKEILCIQHKNPMAIREDGTEVNLTTTYGFGAVSYTYLYNKSVFIPSYMPLQLMTHSMPSILFPDDYLNITTIENPYYLTGCSGVVSPGPAFYFLGCHMINESTPRHIFEYTPPPSVSMNIISVFSSDNPHYNTTYGSAVTTDNGYIIYYGGTTYTIENNVLIPLISVGAVTILKVDTMDVVKRGKTGPPRFQHEAVLYKNQYMYVYGGMDTSLEVYNVKNDAWQTAHVFPIEFGLLPSIVLHKDYLMVMLIVNEIATQKFISLPDTP